MVKFSSYLTENTWRLHYNGQLVNVNLLLIEKDILNPIPMLCGQGAGILMLQQMVHPVTTELLRRNLLGAVADSSYLR